MGLSLTRENVHSLARWFKDRHGDEVTSALDETVFDIDDACGILCQETGSELLLFLGKVDDATALRGRIGDASGDYPGTSRSAFPRNTADFRSASAAPRKWCGSLKPGLPRSSR